MIKKIMNVLKYWRNDEYLYNLTMERNFELFKKKEIIFIHIPKAAGISFSKAIFGKESYGHARLKDYIRKFGENEINNFQKITIVRNPYDRLLSSYNYLRAGGRQKGTDMRYCQIINRYLDFEDFVLNVFKDSSFKEIQHLIPQVEWLKDINGNINFDYIGKFENIDKSYEDIRKLIPNNSLLPNLLYKENRGPNKEQDLFSREIISTINRVYIEDFELLNYPIIC